VLLILNLFNNKNNTCQIDLSPLPPICSVWHSRSNEQLRRFQHSRITDLITVDPIHLSRIDLPLRRSCSPCRSPTRSRGFPQISSGAFPICLSRTDLHLRRSAPFANRQTKFTLFRDLLGATPSEKSALIKNRLEYKNWRVFPGKIRANRAFWHNSAISPSKSAL